MEKLKKSLVVWVSIYPLITFILSVFGKQLGALPIALRTLVLTLVLVPVMVYVLIPFWTKVLQLIIVSRSRKK